MDRATVRDRAGDLPAEPGVYRFLEGDTTLYVGKAVDLRDRVRSYVDPRSERIARMVDRADDLTVTVTEGERQALLLEANLIKRHQPRYNVRLKDDKSYPFVQLTGHEAPRIELTRDPDPDADVFGPFSDVGRTETVLKAIRSTFGLRGCSDHKYAGRDRPCLDHEMGLCTAPCTGEVSTEEYRADVDRARRFLAGETATLADPIREAMQRAARAEAFERAANLRDRLQAVEAFHGGGRAVVDASGGGSVGGGGDAGSGDDADHGRSVDVLGAALDGDGATVARLHAEDGKLVDRDRHRLAGLAAGTDGSTAPAPPPGSGPASRSGPEREPGAESASDPPRETADDRRAAALGAFLAQFYAERSFPDAVLVPVDPADPDLRRWLDREGVDLRVPGAGRERRLVDLAEKNARRGRDPPDGVAALADRLGVEARRIEGFDVSHTGGSEVVGSDVRFVDGDPEKSGYRRKKLADDADDPESMRELVAWRARRAVEGRDDRTDPDLLVVDGGREQLRAARDALWEAGWDRPVVAIAKGADRDSDRAITAEGPRDWDRDGPAMRLLRRVRDEAHRFAVDYHRTLRDEVSTALDDVRGVGPALRERLLGRFGSVAGLREASRSELQSVEGVGPALAERIDRRLSTGDRPE